MVLYIESQNIPQIVLLSVVLCLFIIFLYIKLAYPFWNVQPVYHVYDFWRGFYRRPFRIHPRFHPKIRTKYTKPDLVITIPFVDCSLEDKKAFVNLVQCYTLSDEDALYMFHLENLDAYFVGHMNASYLSFYKETFYTVKKEKLDGAGAGAIAPGEEDTTVVREMIPRGCISSRSGVLSIGVGGSGAGAFGAQREPIYYIDFMTTVRGLPNDIAIHRVMFDTHMYNVGLAEWKEDVTRKLPVGIGVGLFKRVGVILAGIVPLVRFTRREYEIPNNPGYLKGVRYPEHVVLVEISAANIRNVLELVGSIYIGGSVELFRAGFKGAVGDVIKKNLVYRRLCIEDISDNGGLDMVEWYYLGEEKGAYYLFNYFAPTLGLSHRAFFMF